VSKDCASDRRGAVTRVSATVACTVRRWAQMPTLTARWVHNPEDVAGEPGETLATRSHQVIREWAEARSALPVSLATEDPSPQSGLLRLRANSDDQRLAKIAWDEWFDAFEADNLVFIFRSTRPNGRPSNFFRLDADGDR